MKEQPFMWDFRGRRSIRLRNMTYAEPGTYFVTICTNKRHHAFGNVINGRMVLNKIGTIVDDCWREIPEHFPNVVLDEYVIMPNHVHGIVILKPSATLTVGARHCLAPTIRQCIANTDANDNTNASRFQNPGRQSLSTIIGSFKSIVSKRTNAISNIRDESIWQRNYYERIITSQYALSIVRGYILSNPRKWSRNMNHRSIISPSSKTPPR